MNHLKSFNALNRTRSHRRALYRNMTEALFKNERIRTTKAKAKEIRRVAEKIITKARVKNLHNIRIINRLIKDKKILMKLFDEIAPRYMERNGGYTRIISLAQRKGDGADMVFLELVEEANAAAKTKKKKKKSAQEVDKKQEPKKEAGKKQGTTKKKTTGALKEEAKEKAKEKPAVKPDEKAISEQEPITQIDDAKK